MATYRIVEYKHWIYTTYAIQRKYWFGWFNIRCKRSEMAYIPLISRPANPFKKYVTLFRLRYFLNIKWFYNLKDAQHFIETKSKSKKIITT
jgi:hypothetical protein